MNYRYIGLLPVVSASLNLLACASQPTAPIESMLDAGQPSLCQEDYCIKIGTHEGKIHLVLSLAPGQEKPNRWKHPDSVPDLQRQVQRQIDKLTKDKQRELTNHEKLQAAHDYTLKLLGLQIEYYGGTRKSIEKRDSLATKIEEKRRRYKVDNLIELLRQKQQLDDANAAKTAFELASLEELALEHERAYTNYQKASFIEPNNTQYLNATGTAALTVGQHDHAVRYYRKSLAITLKNKGKNDPEISVCYDNLGTAWQAKGNFIKAIEYYQRSLILRINTIGKGSPDVAISYTKLGNAWQSKGEQDKAIEYYQRALTIIQKTKGEYHPDVATIYNHLANAWKAKGNSDKAIEYYQKSVSVILKSGERKPTANTSEVKGPAPKTTSKTPQRNPTQRNNDSRRSKKSATR